MGKHFYSHFVKTESLVVELDTMDLSPDEKDHLTELIDSNIHHAVIHTVLSELPPEEKKIFLHLVDSENHELLWDHLKTKTKDIEHKIENAIGDIIGKLHKDIGEVKEKKK